MASTKDESIASIVEDNLRPVRGRYREYVRKRIERGVYAELVAWDPAAGAAVAREPFVPALSGLPDDVQASSRAIGERVVAHRAALDRAGLLTISDALDAEVEDLHALLADSEAQRIAVEALGVEQADVSVVLAYTAASVRHLVNAATWIRAPRASRQHQASSRRSGASRPAHRELPRGLAVRARDRVRVLQLRATQDRDGRTRACSRGSRPAPTDGGDGSAAHEDVYAGKTEAERLEIAAKRIADAALRVPELLPAIERHVRELRGESA